MPDSIRNILAMLPTGVVPKPLEPYEVAGYLFNNYVNHKREMLRRAEAQLRNDLYNDMGDREISQFFDRVYADPKVRELRKQWIPISKHTNVTKRIMNEISVVYQEPATRAVDGEENNERYQQVIRLSRQDEVFAQVNTMLNLHRALFVRPRVLMVDSTTREPAIDIATPADAYAIRHPNDPTRPIGVIVSTGYFGASRLSDYPAFEVWTDVEKFQLTADGKIVQGSWIEHGLGVNPWLFLSLEPPSKNVWPVGAGKDIEAAHLAIWFINVQLLKETKSLNKQHALMGDMTTAARDQVADSEVPIELPDGTVMQSIDSGVDTAQYRENANHILEQFASNYGISAGQLRHQGVQSAEARELMRAPIRELRERQIKLFREFERRFAEVQSVVMRADMPQLFFSTNGWSIKFADIRTPLSTKERLEVFEHARRMGLTNTVRFLQEEYGLSRSQAMQWLSENVDVELQRNVLMRPLQVINGSMRADVDDSSTAQENGEQGQEVESNE